MRQQTAPALPISKTTDQIVKNNAAFMVFLQKVSGRNWIFASEPINRIRSGKNRNFTFTEIREITIRYKNTPFRFHITTEAGSR